MLGDLCGEFPGTRLGKESVCTSEKSILYHKVSLAKVLPLTENERTRLQCTIAGAGDDLVVKNIDCSFRGHRFGSQHPELQFPAI